MGGGGVRPRYEGNSLDLVVGKRHVHFVNSYLSVIRIIVICPWCTPPKFDKININFLLSIFLDQLKYTLCVPHVYLE